jgi:sulfocyanin
MKALALVAAVTTLGLGTHADPVKVNDFMSYDATSKTVTLRVISAYNSTLGGFNFNGGSRGSHVITIPLGWQVNTSVTNNDAIPHSAIVIPGTLPLPGAPDQAAIGGAYTQQLAPQNGHDTMNFKAAPAGKYWIACGIPGHAASGMYITLVIDPNAKAPTYTGL